MLGVGLSIVENPRNRAWWTSGATMAAQPAKYRFMLDGNGVSHDQLMSTTRATPATTYAENLDDSLQAFSVNTSRITGTGQLFEGSDTNEALYSQSIENLVGANHTISNSSVEAPWGGFIQKDIFSAAPAANTGFVTGSIAVSISDIVTISGWCGGVSGYPNQIRFGIGGTSDFWGQNVDSTFEIISGPGTITQLAGSFCEITGLSATELTKFRITRTFQTSGTGVQMYIYPNDSSGQTTAGNLIGGLQMEFNGTVSSYIPTTSAAVTRDPDNTTLVREENLALWSEDFTNAVYSPGNVTITPTAADGPRGTGTMTKLEVSATAAASMVQAGIIATDTSHTYSIIVRKGSGATDANRFILRNDTTATNLVNVTLNYDTGVASGATVESLGNNIYLLHLTATTGITVGDSLRVYLCFAGASETAGEYAYVDMAQVVSASTPLPYTKTTSSTISLPFKGFNASEGTFVFKFKNASGSGGVFSAHDSAGVSSNRIDYRINGSVVNISSGGTTVASLVMAAASTTADNKIAIAYKVNDFAASLNGAAVVTDASGAVPVGINEMTIGAVDGDFLTMLDDYLIEWEYFPTRKSNAELQTLSTV